MSKEMTMNNIGGYAPQKREAQKIIDFFNNYEKYINAGAELPRGILFYGEPGNGKTMFANAIASASNAKAFSLSENLYLKDDIDITTEIQRLFEEAKRNAPSIIILDEIDQLVNCEHSPFGGKSSDNEKELLRILLTEIDKLQDTSVLIIATGNVEIAQIPPALIRNGRIEKHIRIDNPSTNDRKEIFKTLLSKNEVFKNINIDILSATTTGCTCSALDSLVNEVLINAIQSNISEVTINDFMEPLQIIITHESKEESEKIDESVIYHEVGHFVADYILNNSIGYLSVDTFGNTGGRYVKVDASNSTIICEKKFPKNKVDVEKANTVLVAGYVSANYFTNSICVGSSSDLKKITKNFKNMNADGLLGLDEYSVRIECNENPFNEGNSGIGVRTKVFKKHLKKIHSAAKKIIKANEEFIKLLKTELEDKHTLSVEEVTEFINKHNNLIVRKNLKF